jgi:phage terminase large subunit GpA-like protein
MMTKKALASLRPPPKLKLSEWIEREVILPPEVSALPGKVKLYPFQREIADAIGDHTVERVSVLKSARVGYTTLLVGALANHVANDPTTMLALLPTEDDCRRLVVSDIEPIFSASPALAGALSGDQMENNRNTMLSRRFPGGYLKAIAAKAPRNLRAHTARVLIVDEADEMENGPQGSPIGLAEKRTMSFADRKIIIGSTPIFEETSNVIRAYASSDRRIYEVPCPECGGFHEVMWKDIHWPESEPAKAHWVCPSCGSVVEQKHKAAMVAAGRWRATAPEVKGHAGFKLNSLISPIPKADWGVLAQEFLSSKSDPAALQTFVNTILGEGWREEGEELDDAELSSRAETFGLVVDEKSGCTGIPEQVMVITAGVDVQRKDRLEVTFIGWDEAGNAYILGHIVIWGMWDDDTTWAELDAALATKWDHPLGGKIGIDATCIDSGDGVSMEKVYAFAFPRFRKKVFAIKGAQGNRPWIEKSKSKTKGGSLWIVGVDGIKGTIYSRLKRSTMIRFSTDLPADWFEQLSSERIVVRYNRGQPSRRFERIQGKAAEALDCTVYAFAARQLVNVNWARRAGDLALPADRRAKASAPKIAKSDWL